LARNVATEVAIKVLAADAGGSDGPLSRNTVVDYLDVLERLMIIENQPAWAPHMWSKAILRSLAKRHFVDPSLAVATMTGSPARLLLDLNLLGLLFESLVVRDLRIFAQPIDGQIFHYRDSNGLEVDTKKCGEPVLLAVISGTGYGYVRPDGISVIPIGALAP